MAHLEGQWPGRARSSGQVLAQVPPHHHANDFVEREPGGRASGNQAAIAQHADPVGNPADLAHPMGYVKNRCAGGAQLADPFEQLVDLGVGQGGGRFVKNQQPAIPGKPGSDLDQLLLSDPQGAH